MTQLYPPSASPLPPIVLLVEDDLDTCEMYHAALEFDGYWVVDAADCGNALANALEIQPDVIVTDLGLPGGHDGIALARGLRQNAKTADIPVLAVTGRDPRALGDDRGLFDEVLLKPVLPDALIGRIRETLAQSHELKQRSEQARARVGELVQASERILEKSHQTFARRATPVFAQPCPKCGDMLEWTERRKLHGVTFDYFRPCSRGCGLFCYNTSDRTMVTLTE
jgi:DNA-binding response OmpR family regulator